MVTRELRVISSGTSGTRVGIISLGAAVVDEESAQRRTKEKPSGRGNYLHITLKAVGGASGSSDPSPSAASRAMKSNLHCPPDFELLLNVGEGGRARAHFPAAIMKSRRFSGAIVCATSPVSPFGRENILPFSGCFRNLNF